MGCVVGIRGWHPENRWSPLWEGNADPKIQVEHQKMNQYHIFRCNADCLYFSACPYDLSFITPFDISL